MIYDQMQTSKMTLDTINKLNHHVFCTASQHDKLGQPFEVTEMVGASEKFSKNFPWKYKINRYGFRGNDWDFKKSPAFFGCSCTFGIGVETPTSEIIQNRYIDRVIPNLGLPGGSAINIIKAFAAFAKLHPMSHAFIILPPLSRFFYPSIRYNSWQLANLLLNFRSSDHVSDKLQKNILKMWTDGPSVSYTLDYMDWANELAKVYDIKLFWSTWDSVETEAFLLDVTKSNFFKWPNIKTNDARDGLHPGQTNHQQVADICWNIINQT